MATDTYEYLKKEVHKVLLEQEEKDKSVAVIVTYDCIVDKFRNKLRDDLLVEKYKASRLSESTYKIPKKQSPRQLAALVNEIIDLFKGTLNESKKALPESVVRLIIPKGKEFRIVEIKFKK